MIADEDRPPIHGSRMQAVEWLERPEYRAAGLAEQVSFRVVYTEQSFAPGPQELAESYWPSGPVSWLGGPAGGITVEQWPCRADGRPLTHVATFDLTDAHDTIDEVGRAEWPGQEGLPRHGVLQVFHDLTETYGDALADRDTRGWCVQWLPEPDRSLLTTGPAGVETPTGVCQVVLPLATFSVPSPTDAIRARAAVFEAAEAADEQIQRMWSWQRTGDRKAAPMPVTHLYGHAQRGDLLPTLQILPAVLPLTVPGDRYRLIVEIESFATLAGWFGDGSPLEVWMRETDLRARAFDRAWCIIRTD